jgi:salicylate hydroxylase
VKDSYDVTIVGAGIGGLTAAIMLDDIGLDVCIVEQAKGLSEVGAGIQVAANATRLLQGIGVDLRAAVVPEARVSRRYTGELLEVQEINDKDMRFGANHLLMHRADLLASLIGRLERGNAVLRLGAKVVEVTQESGSANVVLADGDRIRASVVVGADGIHSTVRKSVFPLESGEPQYSGTVAFRGIVDVPDLPVRVPNTSTKFWGPVDDHHIIHYPVSGGRSINFVGVVPQEEWSDESWTLREDPDVVRQHFAEYASPIPELLSACADMFRWALYYRQPLATWVNGRVTLLGDACHAMTPFLGQGAAMSIEDACVLARCLSQGTAAQPGEALATYELNRLERTAKVQLASRVDSISSWSDRDWVFGYDAASAPLMAPAR